MRQEKMSLKSLPISWINYDMEGRVRTLAKKEGKSGEDTRRERGATNGYKHTKCSREV